MTAISLVAAMVAEAVPGVDPASGWTAAGIATAVIGWLIFRHIPSREKQNETLTARLLDDNKEDREKFTEALDKVIEHCREEISVLKGKQ